MVRAEMMVLDHQVHGVLRPCRWGGQKGRKPEAGQDGRVTHEQTPRGMTAKYCDLLSLSILVFPPAPSCRCGAGMRGQGRDKGMFY
ncbi:hypothetical protein AA15237_0688 [Komagataeibacter xylinus NBRC 15237]|nr:hypothetical protein AA15237_0688 [Komagataeibacter xylinus NBRC 15237]